jgi:hypothetical protein
MKNRLLRINIRRSRKAFPGFFYRKDLDLSLGSLGHFLETSEGLIILCEVNAGVGGNKGVLQKFLHFRPILVDSLYA